MWQRMTDIMLNPKIFLSPLARQLQTAIQSLKSLKSDRHRSLDAYLDARSFSLSE